MQREEILFHAQHLEMAGHGNGAQAIQARADKHALDTAWEDYLAYWAVAAACTGSVA
jgi:hypothetical protein